MRTVLFALALAIVPATARAEDELARAEHALTEAKASGTYTFCTKPRKPMLPKHAALCPLASEVDDCAGFANACDEAAKPKPPPQWLEWLARALAPFANLLLWGIIVVIVVAIAVPIVLAFLRARREQRTKSEPVQANTAEVVTPLAPAPEDVSDPEAALRAADEHARRGEADRAVALYLVASLAALDRRGAVRLARHRTNGEYVRSCTDPEAKQPLREVVREVDKVTYGKQTPSAEAVARVAERATHLVKRAAVAATMLVAILSAGCGTLKGTGTDDPAGDQLPVDVLGRSGFRVERLGRSLSSLPIASPEDEEAQPREVVIVDLERVQLEDETRAHLLRWIEHGGTLLLFGDPSAWPEDLGAKEERTHDRAIVVTSAVDPHERIRDARVATAQGLAWKDARVVAHAGETPYAAIGTRGRGAVVGVATDDLFTNVGVSRPANAAALLALVDHAVRAASAESSSEDDEDEGVARKQLDRGRVKLRVARPEDGIPPPSNPFASLVRAGLGTASWHALAGAVVLFLAYGIRRARPRPAPAPARRAFTEHVEATGAFYERARALPHALAAYAAFVDTRLRERAPRGTPPAAYLAHHAAVPVEEASNLLERGLAAVPGEDPRGDELDTIRALRDLYAKTLG